MQIKQGTLLAVSQGEYSDYGVITIAKAKQDFETDVLVQEYLSTRPEQTQAYHFKELEFVKWLVVDKDLLDEADYKELHLDDYSTVSLTLADKAKVVNREY